MENQENIEEFVDVVGDDVAVITEKEEEVK